MDSEEEFETEGEEYLVTGRLILRKRKPGAGPTANINVDPNPITEGGSATLTWSSTGGATATLKVGAGAPTGVALNDSLAVNPTVTTTYLFVVTAAGGATAQSQVMLTVNPVQSGTLTANATYYNDGPTQGPAAIPITLTADSQTNQIYVTASSTQGGDVTITPSGVPSGMSTSGGTNSLWITFSGFSYGSEPAEGTHNINLALADTFGNSTSKTLSIRKRVPYQTSVFKSVIRFIGPRKQGTTWMWDSRGAIVQSASGTVTLDLKVTKQFEGDITGMTAATAAGLTVQWYKNGVAWGAAQAAASTKSWDTTLEENQAHVVEARPVSVTSGHLPDFRSVPSLFLVDNGTPRAGSYTVGVIEQGLPGAGSIWQDTQSSDQISLLPNTVTFPGNRPRRADSFPYTHVFATLPANDSERLALKSPSAWVIEPVVPRDTWGHTIPTWLLDQNDIPYLGQHFPRVGVESEASFGTETGTGMRKFADWCGPRGDNAVSEYSTFFPVPDGSWIGIQIDGRMFHRRGNGSVRTICGYAIAPASTVIPKDPRNPDITATQVRANQETLVQGDFTGYTPGAFNLPNDLCIDVADSKKVYVSDTENHRIALVTFADTSWNSPVVTTYKDLTTYNANAEPYSLTQDTNGDIYVADRDLGQVYKVAAGGGAVTLVANVPNAQVIRLNSLGQLIVGSPPTDATSGGRGKVVRVNKSTGAVTLLVQTGYMDQTFITPPTWIWLDVDKWGNVGPLNTIYLASSLPSSDSTYGMGGQRSSIMAIYVDGSGDVTDADNFMIDCNGGPFAHGRPGSGDIFDPFGHYPWPVVVHSHECRMLFAGYGGVGQVEWRRWLSGDPANHPEDGAVYTRGQRIHLLGTVPDWPLDSRPSLATIHGVRVFNYTGNLKQADDYGAMSDATLNAAIQAGLDSGVARPEVTGNHLRDYRFFLRRSSLQGFLADVRPDANDGDTTAPTVSSVVATPSGTQVTVTWTTSESAIGFVEFGLDDYYGRHKLETAFVTSHSEVITGLASGTYHYRVVAKDAAGNVTRDQDRTFAIS